MMTDKLSVLERMRRLDQGCYRDDDGALQRLRQADRDAFNKAREATVAIIDATNTMGSEDPVMLGIIRGFMETHRYLQGQGIVAFLKAIGTFGRIAKENHLYDARNAHIVEMAEMLREALKDRIYWEEEKTGSV